MSYRVNGDLVFMFILFNEIYTTYFSFMLFYGFFLAVMIQLCNLIVHFVDNIQYTM